MAIITGIIWLLPIGPLKPAEDTQRNLPSDAAAGRKDVLRLDGVVLTMAYGVSTGVTVLLAATVYDYLQVVTRGKVPGSWTAWTLVSPAFVAMIAVGVALLRSRSQAMADRAPTAALKLATYGILIYALVGTIFLGIVGNLDRHWWNPASGGVVAASIVSGLVIPGLLFVALIHAMPRLTSAAVKTNRINALDVATMTSLYAQAAACQAEGKFSDAIPLYCKILSNSERVLGPDGHEVLAARRNLAAAYVLACQPDDAIRLYQDIAQQAERDGGPDHPDTIAALNNLAYASAMTVRSPHATDPPIRGRRRQPPMVEYTAPLVKVARTVLRSPLTKKITTLARQRAR